MKNIHTLPTEKPSRLGRFIDTGRLSLRTYDDIPRGENINIYITSDVEIKGWFIVNGINGYSQPMKYSVMFPKDKFPNGHDKNKLSLLNIILTTDPDLIKDGVQAIDDKFLEWFVKNPSCESVEIDIEKYVNLTSNPIPIYKIIIPQEEQCTCKLGEPYNNACCKVHGSIPKEKPKQIKCYCGHTITCDCEPLQETLKEFINQSNTPEGLDQFSYDKGLEDGVKWQQEQDKNKYSEEEVRQMFNRYNEIIAHRDIEEWQPWIEKQFKKKFG